MRSTKQHSYELILDLEHNKGVTFNWVSKEDAVEYLSKKNTFMRTMSYGINYRKFDSGEHCGEYENLDFAYLIELSKIDMKLRKYFLQMAIDLEHSIKVCLLHGIEENDSEDGYAIVADFLIKYPKVKVGIEKKKNAVLVGGLIEKYLTCSDFPIWTFVETISFGDLVRLYSFYCDRNSIRPIAPVAILNSAVNLRNACAHNNCIFRDLNKHDDTKPNAQLSIYVSRIKDLGRNQRQTKLSVRPLLEIVSLFYCYEKFVPSDTRITTKNELSVYTHGRMIQNIKFFETNDLIKTSLHFIVRLVDNLS